VNLKVEDYYPSGKRFLLRFKEKGGKEKELPVHHKLEELLDQYLKASCLEKELGSPLFPDSIGKTGKLSRRPLVRTDAADMLKRRLKQARLPAHYSPHSFRATGITNFLENDGALEAAQRIAGHADSRTTNSMTVAVRRCYSGIWSGSAISGSGRTGWSLSPGTRAPISIMQKVQGATTTKLDLKQTETGCWAASQAVRQFL
jgi:site-specific recombinase XerD